MYITVMCKYDSLLPGIFFIDSLFIKESKLWKIKKVRKHEVLKNT